MRLNKKVTTAVAALAFAFAVSSAHAAAKKAEPSAKDAVAKIDKAVKAMQANSKPKANKLLEEANNLLAVLPDCEEKSEAKGYYYQAKAEMELFLNNNVEAFEENKKLCEENSKNYGAELNYLAGSFFLDVAMKTGYVTYQKTGSVDEANKVSNQFYKKSADSYLLAFELDPELNKLSANDLNKFQRLCTLKGNYSAMALFYDKYINSKTRFYLSKLGANATAIYETTKADNPNNIVKAVLVTILDLETQENPKSDELVAILEKNFSKYKECASAIAFVKKFYSNATFTQADLNSLPAGVRDFMPVRYMYKIKTSNDVVALSEEFGTFFGHVANYKARIAAKNEITKK